MIGVFCLDEEKTYYFAKKTPYEALMAMIYTLNVGGNGDPGDDVIKMCNGRTLSFDHRGKTYAAVM